MNCHPVDEPWIIKILEQLSETTCTIENRTQAVEFKENFGFANLPSYARTMAAFANSSGGYLVFGVRDNPRELIGLVSEKFQLIDPSRISIELNQVVDPALNWRHGSIEIGGVTVGYIYAGEAKRKPVVCKRSEGALREGAIYFRYPGTTQEIRYAELISMLDDVRQSSDEKWLRLISQIASVGIDNSALLDLNSGKVSGQNGAVFIPEELLPQLQFVREGEFVETVGAPTLKLIGEVQLAASASAANDSVDSVQIIQVPTHIDGADVIRAFLRQERVIDPKQWPIAISGATSAYYPFHYFRLQAELSIEAAIDLLEQSPIRSQGKMYLLKRLREGSRFALSTLSRNSEQSKLRAQMLTKLRDRTATLEDASKYTDKFLEATLHLAPESSDLMFVLRLLNEAVFPSYAAMKNFQATRFRTAVAHLDEAWFGKK